MNRRALRLLVTFVAASSVAVLGQGCKKDPPPAPIAAPPPPPQAVDAAPVDIKPLDDAPDAAPEAGPAKAKARGPAVDVNAARIKQCCNAIHAQAKQMGAAPEAAYVLGVAVQCDLFASQIGGGTAPEFAQVRTMLKGRTIPAACSGM